jgi:hypothetical protein
VQQQVTKVHGRPCWHVAVMGWVLQGEAVADVASIWNCKISVAKTLLMHYMWDKDKLMSEFRAVCWPGCADHSTTGTFARSVTRDCVAWLLWKWASSARHLTGNCSIAAYKRSAASAARQCMLVHLNTPGFRTPAAASNAWLSADSLPNAMSGSSCR